MIGMKKRKNYVAFLRRKDKFIALDRSNVLTSWNITTGKVISQFRLKIPIVSGNYEIYKSEESDKTYVADWY